MQLPEEPSLYIRQRITDRLQRMVKHLYVFVSAGILLFVVLFVALVVSMPPRDFPINTPVIIDSGLSAAAIAEQMDDENVVRFADILYVILVLLHDPSDIKAGAYVFHEKHNVFSIARQITSDSPPAQQVSLTFFEGTTAAHYAYAAAEKLDDFDVQQFAARGRSYEGFLFPDTYYVPYSYTAPELIDLLFQTYHDNVAPLMAQNRTDHSEYEIITIASLLEREGSNEENMRMIAGILENRLALGMPLQLDASIEYVLDKPLSELTPADLRRDSPYNTYLNTGLPPSPIGNPGLQAIAAALHPIPSEYLFYITGNDGNFYYAETYEEHMANIEQHLR